MVTEGYADQLHVSLNMFSAVLVRQFGEEEANKKLAPGREPIDFSELATVF